MPWQGTEWDLLSGRVWRQQDATVVRPPGMGVTLPLSNRTSTVLRRVGLIDAQYHLWLLGRVFHRTVTREGLEGCEGMSCGSRNIVEYVSIQYVTDSVGITMVLNGTTVRYLSRQRGGARQVSPLIESTKNQSTE